MAVKPLTLEEKIKRGQSLAQQSTSELAASQGLVSAPVTAVGTAAIQGTPQQQAMAGTPAQKKGALAAATEVVAAPAGETALEQALKTRPQSAQDQAKLKEMGRFSAALGTYGDKVNQWIEGVLTTATTGGVKTALELTPENQTMVDTAKASLSDPDKKLLDDALTVLKTPGQTEAAVRSAIFTLNQKLGKDSTEKLVRGSEYEQYWKDVQQTVGTQLEAGVQKAARGADDKLTLQDITTLGTSKEELASLLNISPAQVDQLTLGDFQNRLAQVGAAQFGQVQAVQAQAASPLVSDAERQALRTTMRQLEEAGIAGAEQQFQNLLSDIDAGQSVDIGGASYTIDELLAQGTIYDIAQSYYAGTDKALIERLRQEEPNLVAFLDKNRTALLSIRAAGTGEADTLVAHNQAEDQTRKLFDGTNILADAKLDASYKTGTVLPVGTKVNWAAAPQAIKDIALTLPPEQKSTAINNLSKLVATGKEMGQPLDEIYSSTGNVLLDNEMVTNYVNTASLYKAADRAMKSDDPATILNPFLLNDVTVDDINAELTRDLTRASLGQPTSQWYEWDTSPKDGKLSAEEARAVASSQLVKPTWGGVQKGQNFGFDALSPKRAQGVSPTAETLVGLAQDGVVTPDELAQSFPGLGALQQAFNSMGRPGSDTPITAQNASIMQPLRDAYVAALDQEKANIFAIYNLDSRGYRPGFFEQIGPVLESADLGKLNTMSAVLEEDIGRLAGELDKARRVNPDLAFIIERNLNDLQGQYTKIKNHSNTIIQAAFPKKTGPTKEAPPLAQVKVGLPEGTLQEKITTGIGKAGKSIAKKLGL